MTKLEQLLIRHEGLRLKPYRCSAGRLTVGVGRNLEARGISEREAELLLENDIDQCEMAATNEFDWFLELSDVRRDVILSMVFNLGMAGVKKFKKMIAAIEREDFSGAADEMMDSLWARQVGKRADELAFMMRNNRYMGGTTEGGNHERKRNR